MTQQVNGQPESLDQRLGPWSGKLVGGCLLLALAGLTAALAQSYLVPESGRRFWLAYVAAFAFVLSLSLGGLFFVFLQHLTRAGWSVLIRRLPEAMAVNVIVLAVLFIPIATIVLGPGGGEIYPWAKPASAEPAVNTTGAGHGSVEITQPGETHEGTDVYAYQKEGATGLKNRIWLNPQAFVGRWAIYFLIWGGISWYFWKRSVQQDTHPDHRVAQRMQGVAAPVAVVYALTLTAAAFDLLMSLNPHWTSTIFGVYFFSGAVVGSVGLLILLVQLLQKLGVLTRAITAEHQHDLGKLLFAFVFFWGYIAFSQFMLIWYANIPEETVWYRIRGASSAAGATNGWTIVALVLLVGHLFIPFAAMLSRQVKRRRALLAFWAVWLLILHWFDLLWLVMPELGPELRIGAMEIGLTLGLTGVYLAGVFRTLARHSLVPLNDPRLGESLAFENI